MRHLIWIFLIALVSCKTQKNVAVDNTSAVDSVAHKEEYRTMWLMDSTLTNSSFDFDTLSIAVERPAEVIRLKAVKGRVHNSRKEVRAAVEGYGRLDSVAYKSAVSSSATDKSVSTAVFSPPNGTVCVLLGGLALLIGALWIWFLRRL